jgi:DNA-binding transcriptional ArsR family regulator
MQGFPSRIGKVRLQTPPRWCLTGGRPPPIINHVVDKPHGLAVEAADELSRTFAALADPTRRAILAHLAEGEATVNELASPFPMSLQAVSKHLRVLERAGLITRGREAQWRPARLAVAPLAEASEWIGRYRDIQTDRFDRLEREIHRIRGTKKGDSDV